MRRLAPCLVIALAGCTQSPTKYPSLLPRPIESQSLAEPDRPAPVVAPDAALDAQIATLKGQLDDNARRFAAAAQAAEAKVAVARGVAEGSERWLDAQSALAELGAYRGPTTTALAEVERLALERGVAGQPPYPALDSLVSAAQAQAANQEDRIGALEAALAGA